MPRVNTVSLVACMCVVLSSLAPALAEIRKGDPQPQDGWTVPADGIRARLTSRKPQYKLGETLHLTLEIQNVSQKALPFPETSLMPIISFPRSHPYGEHRFSWVITCEQPNTITRILWDQRKVLQEARDVRSPLKPGEIHRIEIRAVAAGKERAKDTPRRLGEPQREQVEFVGAHEPGVYLLKATHDLRKLDVDRNNPAMWVSKYLVTPTIRIEIVK